MPPPATGKPVQFVSVPDAGVPRVGVTSVGDVARTTLPLPVTATPCITVADVHSPIWPLVGVPEFDTLPAPAGVCHVPSPRQNVDALADVPELRLVTGKFPVTPVVRGNPVQLVRTPLAGVPSAGVVSVGDVNVLFVSVSVVALPTSVSVAAGNVRVLAPAIAVATNPIVPDVAPANVGVPVKAGEPANTAAPVPVSSVSKALRFADVGVVANVS